MTSVIPVQCRACAHYGAKRAGTCDAFPDAIPLEILLFGADHREPMPGDHGVRFEQAGGDSAAEAFAQWRDTFGTA